MTFRDTPVLIGDDVNEGDEDVLENIELQSQFKQRMMMKKQ